MIRLEGFDCKIKKMYADKINDPIMNFLEDGHFFYSRSKFTKNTTFWFFKFLVIIYNSYFRAI